MDNEQPVVLVTGGASGIGAAVLRRLASQGARLIASDYSAEGLKRIAEEIPGLVTVQADVTSESDADRMVATAIEAFGQLDGAVNSAGLGVAQPAGVADTEYAAWRRVLDVDLDGVFLSMRAEIPAIIDSGGGAIVNIASVMGSVALAGTSPYAAAKHGLIGLTKAAALDYADRGVRVNTVSPGFVDTPLLSESSRRTSSAIAGRHPLGRLAEPEEISGVIAFLLSPEASFITGADYLVDGGYTAL